MGELQKYKTAERGTTMDHTDLDVSDKISNELLAAWYQNLHSMGGVMVLAERVMENALLQALDSKAESREETITFLASIAEIVWLERHFSGGFRMPIRNKAWETYGRDSVNCDIEAPVFELDDEQVLSCLRAFIAAHEDSDPSDFMRSDTVKKWITAMMEPRSFASANDLKHHIDVDYTVEMDPRAMKPRPFVNDQNEAIAKHLLGVFHNALRLVAQSGWSVGHTDGINADLGGGVTLRSQSGTAREMTLQLEDKDMVAGMYAGVIEWADRLYPEPKPEESARLTQERVARLTE